MASHPDILMVDRNPNSCPSNQCVRLPYIIRNLLPSGKIHFEGNKSLSRGSPADCPEVILFRPSPQESLEELARFLRTKWERSSVMTLFCAGWEDTRKVLQCVKHSGDDFLSCPFKESDLFLRVQRLLNRRGAGSVSRRAKAIKEKLHLESLVGEGERFLRVVEKIPLLAQCAATVLISGETGSGKEVVARAIHYEGSRQEKPFIPVNCGALPDHLFENELFGHSKGAFTDAASAEKGLIAEAEGGTLFLDEIDSLTPSGQVKLLRFLQDGEYRPLGSSRFVVADVRVIAATNADLTQRVKAHLFREDLYYRLNSLSLLIPPLREHVEDIVPLSNYFLARYARERGEEPRQISLAARQKLAAYSWPGNVRELESVMMRALVLSVSGTLQPEDIDLPSPRLEGCSQRSSLRIAKAKIMQAFERNYLVDLLTAHRGNITHAARAAGKERRAFQRLLRKYDLDRHSFQP